MSSWSEKLQEGLPVIKEHYILFIIVFALGIVISFFAVDTLYKHSLTTKDSTIEAKDTAITNKDSEISNLKDSNKSMEDEIERLEKKAITLKDENESLKTQKPLISNWAKQPMRIIVDKTFQNEVVKIDGNSYLNCTFENTTFEYEGDKPFHFNNCNIAIEGNILSTHNPRMKRLLNLLKDLNIIKSSKKQ